MRPGGHERLGTRLEELVLFSTDLTMATTNASFINHFSSFSFSSFTPSSALAHMLEVTLL